MSGPTGPFPLSASTKDWIDGKYPWLDRGGPETPFPLLPARDPDYRDLSEKYGFCRDCPFPSEAGPEFHELTDIRARRQFGKGSYTASEIAGFVTITATGIRPHHNTIVQLVQLPLMIWPPRYALYITEQAVEFGGPIPFHVETALATYKRLEAVVVQDADGIHVVPVENF